MGKYCAEMVKRCADWVRENGLIDDGGAKITDFCVAIFLLTNLDPER